MDIPLHAQVSCSDQECGETTLVIVDPAAQEVTHVIVREKRFPYNDHLVPVDQIESSSADQVRLRCSTDELAKLPQFNESEFAPGDGPYLGYPIEGYMVWPYMIPEMPILLEHEHIPPGELAIRRGARVKASDGDVGKVDEFLIDPSNGHITHLVLLEGHLWGRKDVSIPVAEIDRIEEGQVLLKLDKRGVGALPAVPAHRPNRDLSKRK
ncbi:MAG: PRC-barrel domain-containing protein [Chloroflexi bacterium]|nr:PRC-barrel domain-containing protein [Chloroflexota bacterium]